MVLPLIDFNCQNLRKFIYKLSEHATAVSIFIICPCKVSFCSGELSEGQSLLVSSHPFNVVLKESLSLFLEVVTLLHCSAGSFQSVHVIKSRGGFHIGWELCEGAWGH